MTYNQSDKAVGQLLSAATTNVVNEVILRTYLMKQIYKDGNKYTILEYV